MRCRDGDQDNFGCLGSSHRRVPLFALTDKPSVICVVKQGGAGEYPARSCEGEEPVRQCLRHEAKEVRPAVRSQARKNRRCIRWNTLRIFSGRARRRWSRIIRPSRKVNVGQAPRVWGYLVTISRSSTSNTKVAPGLIVGGAPLSP